MIGSRFLVGTVRPFAGAHLRGGLRGTAGCERTKP
jgi:hypothetical protein